MPVRVEDQPRNGPLRRYVHANKTELCCSTIDLSLAMGLVVRINRALQTRGTI